MIWEYQKYRSGKEDQKDTYVRQREREGKETPGIKWNYKLREYVVKKGVQ